MLPLVADRLPSLALVFLPRKQRSQRSHRNRGQGNTPLQGAEKLGKTLRGNDPAGPYATSPE
jgi:hypothetical protein